MFSALLGYLVVEAGYRVYAYCSIRNTLLAATRSQIPANRGDDVYAVSYSVFDVDTGYRYRPNIEVQFSDPFPVAWKTNSHGHIARSEYPVAKPRGRFRIGLVGDSFTANVDNTIRWGDVLEDRLNASEAWRVMTGGRHVRVINFGLDGIGVVQFDDVAVEMAVPFEVDLLLVNLVREDVRRRPYYRGSASATIIRSEQLTSYIDAEVLSRLPFWSIYPEVIARTLGHWLHLTPRLTASRHYERDEDAIDASVAAVQRLRCYFPDAIFLVHPEYEDLRDPTLDAAFEGFAQRLPEVTMVDMAALLPGPSTEEQWDNWFLPDDGHPSDLGLRIYGETVAAYLIDRFQERRLAGDGQMTAREARCP